MWARSHYFNLNKRFECGIENLNTFRSQLPRIYVAKRQLTDVSQKCTGDLNIKENINHIKISGGILNINLIFSVVIQEIQGKGDRR